MALATRWAGRPADVSPVRLAVMRSALIALAYVALGLLYIHQSSRLVLQLSPDVTSAQAAELIKGSAFILVTGALLGVLTYLLFLRVEKQNRRIMEMQASIGDQERQEVLRVGVGAFAHDANNMLAIIQSHASLLAYRDDEDEESPDEVMARIEEATQHVSDMLRQIQHLQQRDDGRVEEVNIGTVGRSLFTLAKHHPKVRNCSVMAEGCEPRWAATVRIHRRAFECAVANLLINAGDATERRGTIRLRIVMEPGGGVSLEVHDSGPGIPKEAWHSLLQPFQTTKPDGSGLGLTSAKDCADRHGGRLELAESDLGGACIRLCLPPSVVVGEGRSAA